MTWWVSHHREVVLVVFLGGGGGSPDVAGLGEWGDSTRNQLPFKTAELCNWS